MISNTIIDVILNGLYTNLFGSWFLVGLWLVILFFIGVAISGIELKIGLIIGIPLIVSLLLLSILPIIVWAIVILIAIILWIIVAFAIVG